MRKPNPFEWILMILGILCIGIGYAVVQQVSLSYGLFSLESAVVILLWFILVVLLLLTAVSENSKEELRTVILQQREELKLLRHDLRRKR